jgi:hypothetical protein
MQDLLSSWALRQTRQTIDLLIRIVTPFPAAAHTGKANTTNAPTTLHNFRGPGIEQPHVLKG